jgi:hypothetical protein
LRHTHRRAFLRVVEGRVARLCERVEPVDRLDTLPYAHPVTRTAVAAMLIFMLAACGKTNPSTTATTSTVPAAAGPTTINQVCDAQTWPRPVPTVVGVILNDATTGSLACWDNINAIAPDGHDAFNNSTKEDNATTYRITDVSPPAGAPIGRKESVTVHVIPVDLSAVPPTFHPCDWVTSDEAGRILGDPSTTTSPAGDEAGSAEPFCSYTSGSHLVTSQVNLPGSFPVDAQTELNMTAANGSEVSGLPGRAYCATTTSADKKSTTLVVLLSGNRLYQALGWEGESCDTLKQIAETAIPRIGA